MLYFYFSSQAHIGAIRLRNGGLAFLLRIVLSTFIPNLSFLSFRSGSTIVHDGARLSYLAPGKTKASRTAVV